MDPIYHAIRYSQIIHIAAQMHRGIDPIRELNRTCDEVCSSVNVDGGQVHSMGIVQKRHVHDANEKIKPDSRSIEKHSQTKEMCRSGTTFLKAQSQRIVIETMITRNIHIGGHDTNTNSYSIHTFSAYRGKTEVGKSSCSHFSPTQGSVRVRVNCRVLSSSRRPYSFPQSDSL